MKLEHINRSKCGLTFKIINEKLPNICCSYSYRVCVCRSLICKVFADRNHAIFDLPLCITYNPFVLHTNFNYPKINRFQCSNLYDIYMVMLLSR